MMEEKTSQRLCVFLSAMMTATELLTLPVLCAAGRLTPPALVIIACVMVMMTVSVLRVLGGRGERLRTVRTFVGGTAALCVTALCLAGSAGVVYGRALLSQRVEQGQSAAGPIIEVAPFAVYLSGSDTRSGRLTDSRSDVNLIAAVNPAGRQVLLVNTPRDYYVKNPAGNGAGDKLTHCGLYGADNSRLALETLYGVTIDYTAQINFKGFVTLIDALGGVTVYSETAFTTFDGVCCIHEGENRLSGAQALSFARERGSLTDGDRDRGENQMALLTALAEQVSPAVLLGNYREILGSLEGMFATDMPPATIALLLTTCLTDLNRWQVLTCSVTGSDGTDYNYSSGGKAYVMYPDADSVSHAAALLERVLRGETVTQAETE